MRYITLLEYQPGLSADIMPPHSALEKTNGSLSPENCHLKIDENGFMVSGKLAMQNDSKIVLLGGSAIENLYIPEDKRVLSRIEDMAATQGKGAKVYSAAISNMHLLHALNILLNKGIALRPDVVVLYMIHGMDLVANETDNSFWNAKGAMNTVRKTGKDVEIDTSCNANNKNDFADQKRLLRVFADLCRNFGIKLFIANSPLYGEHDTFLKQLPAHLMDVAMFDQQQALIARLNNFVRDICRETDCGLIDLEKTFAGLEHRKYFYDINHPNSHGCDVIAAATAQTVQSILKTQSTDKHAASNADTLATLENIFRDILDIPDLVLTESLTARDVPEWDSLNHIRLISAAEQKFAVRLSSLEVERLKCAGDLADIISSKRA